MALTDDLKDFFNLLEIIAKVRVEGFLPKNINIIFARNKIVITPFDNKFLAQGNEDRDIDIELVGKDQIRICGLKSTDIWAKIFAERIKENIKKDEYLGTKYSVQYQIRSGL